MMAVMRCVVLALAALAPFCAYAEGNPDLVARYMVLLPAPAQALTAQALEERTELKEGVALGDATMAFSVRVPNTWSAKTPLALPGVETGAEGAALKDLLPEEVARWEGPVVADGRSILTVEAAQMPYQMTVAQWLLHEILSNSYTIEGFAPEGDRAVQAAYVAFVDGSALVVRARAQVSGRHVLIARYAIPIERRDEGEERNLQAAVVNSFSLTNPALGPMEAVKTHLFLDIARLIYPASWRLTAPPVRSIDRMGADLYSISAGGALEGEMHMVLLSRYAGRPLAEEVGAMKADLGRKGLALGAQVEVGTQMPRALGIGAQVTEVYAATGTAEDKPIVPHEYWFTVGTSGDYIYIATLLTPAQGQDYFAWARNVEAYRLVLAAFGPQEVAPDAAAPPPG